DDRSLLGGKEVARSTAALKALATTSLSKSTFPSKSPSETTKSTVPEYGFARARKPGTAPRRMRSTSFASEGFRCTAETDTRKRSDDAKHTGNSRTVIGRARSGAA